MKLEKEFREIENELNTPLMSQTRSNIQFKYNPPHNFNAQNVLGKVMTLFKINDLHKFGTAIETAAGG